MEIRTLVASLHTATTAAGNGNSASNPTGGGLIAGTLTGLGYVTAVCVLEASVAGSVWIPLAEPVEFRGHGVVEVEHYYSATAPLIRLRVVSITGTLAVGAYRVEEGDDDPIEITPSGALVTDRPMHSIRPGCKGFRKVFGRLAALANDTTNGTTYQDVISLEQDFDAIQIVIATIQTSVTTVRSAHYFNVCADASLTDAQMDALPGWAFVDWDENDGNSVRAQFATPAAGNARPRYLISQKKQANSIPRTDGGSLPLLVVRSHLYNNNATPTVCGNGTTDVFSNVARTDGRTHKTRKCTGNGMTTFSSGADAIQTPLVGIIYWSRGRVVNVAKFGDSIWQDRNGPMGDGWMRDEVIRRSRKSGIAYEIADFAWSGQTSANYHNIAMDAVGQFPIDIAGYPAASPNDIASGASLATATSTLKTIRNRHQEFVTECADNEVVPIIGTFAPVTTAVNNYTLCDQARIDFNNEVRALKTRGVLVADLDASLAGATVGGQVQPIAGTMLDGIHPGPVGRELVRSQQIAPAMSAISVIL